MSERTILVIDDSATIRKLVDTTLSPAGFNVLLAPTAEDGIRLAEEAQPDLILLDHQLPGTTGYEVCCQLSSSPNVQTIPVVVSSTLRKKAYVEYTELPNVVDMLPKPYTADLLTHTVENGLDTGKLIVESQSQGTAVPEVIHEVGNVDLMGKFVSFGLREVIDFLNNGNKTGVLEVEAGHARFWFHLAKGRILGVAATGIDIGRFEERLPSALQDLAPVLNLTISGRACAEVDGLVQLLDRKVLDPRLLGQLLRYQAAMLVHRCFRGQLNEFSFEANQKPPSLYQKLPLNISLLALLVEAAMHCDESELPASAKNTAYVRRAIRGQNLDRAGLSAKHMKLIGLLSEPRSVTQFATKLGWNELEVRRVLYGLTMAELVETQEGASANQLVVFEPDPVAAEQLRRAVHGQLPEYAFKVVRDQLALSLVLKRNPPAALAFAIDSDEACDTLRRYLKTPEAQKSTLKLIGIASFSGQPDRDLYSGQRLGFEPHALLARPVTAERLAQTLDGLFDLPSPELNSKAPVDPGLAGTGAT